MYYTKENVQLKATSHLRDKIYEKFGLQLNVRQSLNGAVEVTEENAHLFKNAYGRVFIDRVRNQNKYTPQQSFYINIDTDQVFVIDWNTQVIVTTYRFSNAKNKNDYNGPVYSNQHNYRQW